MTKLSPHPALTAATADLQAKRQRIIENAAMQAPVDADAKQLQRERDALARKEAALAQRRMVLHQERAEAETALAVSEEAAIAQLAVAKAADILRLQTDDAISNFERISAEVNQLRSMVRSELDTPGNQKYSVHPLIRQALELVPPPDILDRPIYELGGAVVGVSDWPTRRRAILTMAIPPRGNPATVQ
jgi:hypothetical protein